MKLLRLLPVLFFLNCSGQNVKDEKLFQAINDPKTEIRGTIDQTDRKEFIFQFYDVNEKDTHFAMLSSKGYQGGGPSWVGIIYGGIMMSEPAILNSIRFDEEAEGVAVWSKSRAMLEKIGRIVNILKSDNVLLFKAIEIAKKDGRME